MPDYNLTRPAHTPYIRSAAIRQNGIVYEGAHHCQIIRRIAEEEGIRPVTGEQGFVTSAGEFVDRVQAGRIAIAARQILTLTHHKEDLFSEELWSWPDGTSPWISVDDYLPPDGTAALVTDGKGRSISVRQSSWWGFASLEFPITHWMPLPPLPAPRS